MLGQCRGRFRLRQCVASGAMNPSRHLGQGMSPGWREPYDGRGVCFKRDKGKRAVKRHKFMPECLAISSASMRCTHGSV